MREKILLVEDELSVRRSICEVLQRVGGYEVHEAGDGLEALELLKSRKFDLVITDYIMPRVDGLKLLEHIRAKCPETRVIFMSGYVSRTAGTVLTQGRGEFLRKPFSLSVLLAKVRSSLRNQIIPAYLVYLTPVCL